MGWMARKEDSPQWLKDFRASRGIPEPDLGPEESILPEPDHNVVRMGAPDDRFTPLESQRQSIPERLISKLPNSSARDIARVATHGLARTGNTILRAIDIPNRIFGNTRSVLQDIYESSEQSLSRDAYEDPYSAVPQIGETAVHLATAGVLGKALPAIFGANVGADTYETAKYAGASEGEALAKGIGHGVVDTAIWTLGQGLASKYLPKAWQWLGRELTGAMRGAASSVTSDAVLNSLGADVSGEEMAKRAVHAAWMVPLLGMLKMGKGSRERALAELKKVRPDLAGERVDKVIETLENEFSDPRSQKVALAWVARKGANLPDDLAQIHQAIEVANKVKGIDFTQKSPFEIISDPAYARYLPKPKPQDVKAFSNMKRYPMGVIGFDVSDDAAGRQATREMINAYMSPSSNPWCLATGSGAAKLGELGPVAKGYWEQHSAVPKQIFFQEVDGKLELTAFRATSPGGEGRQEYWDTSDAGYSGIPLKVKVPGDPMGRYRKMVFRPAGSAGSQKIEIADPTSGRTLRLTPGELETEIAQWEGYVNNLEAQPGFQTDLYEQQNAADFRNWITEARAKLPQQRQRTDATDEVQGTFEDIAPGKLFKGDPFRDGRSQTWVVNPAKVNHKGSYDENLADRLRSDPEYSRLNREFADGRGSGEAVLARSREIRKAFDKEWNAAPQPVLIEDKVRTTENGITKFRTTKYADPTNWDYEPPKPGEQPKPVEIEESELVSPEWMRSRGYDPESEADVRRMQETLNIQPWGNGMEAAMAVVPTKRTYMQTKSGTPETVTYGPNGRDVVSVDFEENGVPYRVEFEPRSPHGAIPSELGISRLGIDRQSIPRPEHHVFSGRGNVRDLIGGVRTIRNPGDQTSEVIHRLTWDEELGGFVRTVGNRRWSLVRTALSGGQDDPNVFMNNRGAGVTERLLVEDRQPDGTWVPVETRDIQASPPRANTLPPPPDSIPFALKAGNTRRDVQVAAKGGDAGTRAAEEGGDSGPETASSETAVPEQPAPQQSGPRIVVNPTVFEDDKDALCVAFNEAFRIVMEDMAFDPVSEPTERQRKFFSDTAYADDETQLRRTILARICTFDTSVKDPTDEQLQEAVEFLENVMEAGYPQDEREQAMVQRIHDVVAQSVGRPRSEETEKPPSDEGTVQAAIGGGETEEEKPDFYDGTGVQGETLADAWLERYQSKFGKYLPEGWTFRINGDWSPENDGGTNRLPILLYDANGTPVAGATIDDNDVDSPNVYDMSSPLGAWLYRLKPDEEKPGDIAFGTSPEDDSLEARLDKDSDPFNFARGWEGDDENDLKFFQSLPGYQEPPKPAVAPQQQQQQPAVAPQQNNGQWIDARGAQNFRDPKDAVDRGENQRRQAWRQYELQQKRDLRRVLRNMTPGMNVSAALKATQGMDDHEANQWFLQAHRAARNGMPTPTRATFPPLIPPLDPNDPNDPRNRNWP